MAEEPFPADGHDGEEPEDSCLLPSDENGCGGLPEGAEQGLYVTLPAEELTLAGSPRAAGPTRWRRAR